MSAPLWFDALALYLIAVKQLLLLAAILLAVSGLDDLAVDLAYGVRRLWRWLKIYRRRRHAAAPDLRRAEAAPLAVLIPAWREADVIADMLRATLGRLDYPDYQLFVGVYPNDPETLAAVRSVKNPRITSVMTSRDGPTSKADCLNHCYAAALDHARRSGAPFKAFVLHDAEDLVDPNELHVLNHLIPRIAMVQLPVVALPHRSSRWVAGSYLDEFAESHTKDLVVREWLGASLPCAGVGCGFAADAIAEVARRNGGRPFNPASLTEDYELGVGLGLAGHATALVRLPDTPGSRLFVATREHFPELVTDAIRQKTRWLLGIALIGWDRIGWRGGLTDRYMLWRDRKALLNALLVVAAYIGLAHLALFAMLPGVWRSAGLLPALAPPGGALARVMQLNGALLIWRLACRALFTARIYGMAEGMRAIPRALVSNWINSRAAMLAVDRYRAALRSRTAPVWDKTRHRFPIGLATGSTG